MAEKRVPQTLYLLTTTGCNVYAFMVFCCFRDCRRWRRLKKGYTQALYLLRQLVECLSGVLLFQRLEVAYVAEKRVPQTLYLLGQLVVCLYGVLLFQRLEEVEEAEKRVHTSIVFAMTAGCMPFWCVAVSEAGGGGGGRKKGMHTRCTCYASWLECLSGVWLFQRQEVEEMARRVCIYYRLTLNAG